MENKLTVYKILYAVSTASGIAGVILLFKDFSRIAAYILIGVWGVLGIIVRILIVADRRTLRKLKEKENGTV